MHFAKGMHVDLLEAKVECSVYIYMFPQSLTHSYVGLGEVTDPECRVLSSGLVHW